MNEDHVKYYLGGVSNVNELPHGLETKSVFDWDNQPLGTVLGSELDPKTRDPTSLIIDLSSDARERLDTEEEAVSLSFDYVFGIRRNEVRLSRGLSELLDDLEPVAQATDEEPNPAEAADVDDPSVELKA